jgi:hypothetical protein
MLVVIMISMGIKNLTKINIVYCRLNRAEAAAQKISDYQAKEKAKMAVSELILSLGLIKLYYPINYILIGNTRNGESK